MLMNELPQLSNIIHSISVPKQIQETDIDELRESVYLVIDDFISNNIQEYRYKDFAHRIFEHTYHRSSSSQKFSGFRPQPRKSDVN